MDNKPMDILKKSRGILDEAEQQLGLSSISGISNTAKPELESAGDNSASVAVGADADADAAAAALAPESDTGAASTMYNINGEPGADAKDVAEEDKIFKYKNLEEVNTARQTKEMELLSKLKTGGRRRSRRRNNKKSAKRGGRKSSKKGSKKHRKSAKKGGKKCSYRKH
jgi:hypothetical protein